MSPAFDLTTALRRLRALVDEDPRGALERLIEHDPLELRRRAAEVVARNALLVDPESIALSAYAGLIEDVERLEPAARGLDEVLVMSAALRASRAPSEALCDAFARALGTTPERATRAIEDLRGRPEGQRRALLATLRATSEAIRTALPGEAHDLRQDGAAVAKSVAILRTLLAALHRR